MKTDFLKGLGLDQEVIDKIMAENGKDIAAEKAKTTKAESERDNYKDQLSTATESLEKFKDVDPTAMQGEIDQLKQQLKDKDTEYAAKEADRIFSDTIKEPDIKEEPSQSESKIITTDEEIEAFYIIRGLLAEVIPVENIVHRDTESYFGILYKDNNRKPICRINLDTKNKQILIPDKDKKFERIYIESLNDLYKYKKQLTDVVKRYL